MLHLQGCSYQLKQVYATCGERTGSIEALLALGQVTHLIPGSISLAHPMPLLTRSVKWMTAVRWKEAAISAFVLVNASAASTSAAALSAEPPDSVPEALAVPSPCDVSSGSDLAPEPLLGDGGEHWASMANLTEVFSPA